MGEILYTNFLNNSVLQWIVSATTFLAVVFGVSLLRRFIISKFKKLPPQVGNRAVIETLQATRKFFLFTLGLYLGAQLLDLPPKAHVFIQRAMLIISALQAAIWIRKLILLWVNENIQSEDGAKATSVRALSFVLQAVLYTTLFLWILDNCGVNITTLVAGLGVGGIAIALAVQNILGDLFASLSIILDKPFVIGDSIKVGTDSGTIESVGLKTTRVRSENGELLIFPNSDLLKSRIRNYKRLAQRRVVQTLGVTYGTPVEKLKEIPGILQKLISSTPKARFERATFKTLSQSSLDFEVIYWVEMPNATTYAETQQEINFKIVEAFTEKDISFAYPSYSVYVEKNINA